MSNLDTEEREYPDEDPLQQLNSLAEPAERDSYAYVTKYEAVTKREQQVLE